MFVYLAENGRVDSGLDDDEMKCESGYLGIIELIVNITKSRVDGIDCILFVDCGLELIYKIRFVRFVELEKLFLVEMSNWI
jgi:hypothetical protein